MATGAKAAIVTGAASGLGRAMALAFAERGADIAAVDRDAAALEETRAACESRGVRALGYVLDVTQESQVAALVDLPEGWSDAGHLNSSYNGWIEVTLP